MSPVLDAPVVDPEEVAYSVRLATQRGDRVVPSRSERRAHPRHSATTLRGLKVVRLRNGPAIALIDLSVGGALVEAGLQLRPGALLTLELQGPVAEAAVRMQVLRCHVSSFNSGNPIYRGACAFTQPIDLPAIIPPAQPERTITPDAFVGFDLALTHLVERCRARLADAAGRSSENDRRHGKGGTPIESLVSLQTVDVVHILEALRQRAVQASDPIGRQLGEILGQILPALVRQDPVRYFASELEHILRQVVPGVALVDPSETEPLRLETPRGTSLDIRQRRLLTTGNHLLKLAGHLEDSSVVEPECVPEAMPIEPVALEPDEPLALEIPVESSKDELVGDTAPSTWQKIVVRYADGSLLKGFTHDFHPTRAHFSLWPHINASAGQRKVVPLARLKAVFFVRDFAGNSGYRERKTFERANRGRRIEVTFADGEIIIGTTLNYRHDGQGFFVNPADPLANNTRIFVIAGSVRRARFL